MAAMTNRKANSIAKKKGALRVLVVGVGNMGASHARAYDKIEGFELAGLCARRIAKRADLPARWSNVPRFADYGEALERLKPDVVSINTWPDTHADYAIRAFEAGATSSWKSRSPTPWTTPRRVVAAARGDDAQAGHRLHPARPPVLDEVHRARAQRLGKPLVMRMNLNQQSYRRRLDLAQEPDGVAAADRRLRRPLCRRDVPDDRRQAGARPRHRRAPERRRSRPTTTATCTSTSTTGRSAGTRRAGAR